MTRKNCQTALWIYEQRRERYRTSYKGPFGRPATKEQFRRTMRKIANKIGSLKRQISIIDRRQNTIIALGNQVAYFIGVNVKNIGDTAEERGKKAKCLFSKYGMEHGITGSYLSAYMGVPPKRASIIRQAFTRSFERNPENRTMYNNFVQYMKEEAERQESS